MAEAMLVRPAAIIVAGGRGTRMGGVDKPGLPLGGSTLRDRALAAARDAGLGPIVHVGPETGDGPAAALCAGLAGLAGLDTAEAIVLAGDLVRPELVVAALADGTGSGADGTVLVDAEGREQWLAGRYRVDAIRGAMDALPRGPRGASLRALLGRLDLARRPVGAEVIADVDTWQDYETAKGLIDG